MSGGGEEREVRCVRWKKNFQSFLETHRCCQILQLHSKVVQFGRCKENHVEHLDHEGGKGEVVLYREDLRKSAVDGVSIHIDTQLPEKGREEKKGKMIMMTS